MAPSVVYAKCNNIWQVLPNLRVRTCGNVLLWGDEGAVFAVTEFIRIFAMSFNEGVVLSTSGTR